MRQFPRARTGRYSSAAIDRALALKEVSPTEYERLPKDLRDSAEEYAKAPRKIEYARIRETNPPEAREMVENLLRNNPRDPEAEWPKLPFPEVVEMMELAARTNNRKSFCYPILAQKGWSRRDWAKESRVDLKTIRDYLSGETDPFPNTRKKLADALGINVVDLPK